MSRAVKCLKYAPKQPVFESSYSNNPIRRTKIKKKAKKKSFVALFFALLILGAYAYYVCPYNYENYFRPLVLNRYLNRGLKVEVAKYIAPTSNYVHNSYLLDRYLLTPPVSKTKKFSEIRPTGELFETKTKLEELFKRYPKLKPAVFVYEYSTGKSIEINSDEVYPSASIIKVPIVFELMRVIEESKNSNDPVYLTDKRTFSEFFRTSGSGNLQRTQSNVKYSLNYLANTMIADSDNSATNMILYEIGGKDGLNRALRNIGLEHTSMGNWLPDLEGTNKTTAREVSEVLYNIDNPNYISLKYKGVLQEYLGNTKNIHLIKEKLPSDVLVLHKTGNIGSMLGDSGIVYTDKGKKYIVTIMVKRPHNDTRAKSLIQDASLIIYNDINNL